MVRVDGIDATVEVEAHLGTEEEATPHTSTTTTTKTTKTTTTTTSAKE